MPDILTLTGLVATTPRHLVTSEGLSITSFRLASTQRRYDRGAQKWVDAETNWFTVTCFRQLAINAVTSIVKGQRVVVTGRLRVREWASGERTGTNVEVDAEALGHDLSWGTSVFTRSVASSIPVDGEPSSDRPAVLEEGDDGEHPVRRDAASAADGDGDDDDSLAGDGDEPLGSARSTPALEGALPF